MSLDREASNKLVFGLLLVGAAALPASGALSTLLAAGGGVGGNWVAEAVGGVFSAGPPPDEALRKAFLNAVREAVSTLRKAYGPARVAHDGQDAFALLRDAAASATALTLPASASDVLAVQQALSSALDQVLYDQVDAQVLLIRERLLATTAESFQRELARNAEAWRLYHGWLLQRLLTQNAAVQSALAAQPAARAVLADAAALEQRLDEVEERLTKLLAALRDELLWAARSPQAGPSVTCQLAEVGKDGRIEEHTQRVEGSSGPIEQIQRTGDGGIISNSSQVVIRQRHPAPRPSDAEASAQRGNLRDPPPVRLRLIFRALGAASELSWEADLIGTRSSHFVSPYADADLALVLRGLDHLQAPTTGLDAAQLERLAQLGLPSAHGFLSEEAHRHVGRALFTALTADDEGAQALRSLRDYATAEGRSLSLHLHFPGNAADLAALPWELLWATDEPTPLLLSHRLPGQLSRHLDLASAFPAPRQGGRPLRLLTIAPHAGSTATDHAAERAARQSAWAALVANAQVELLPELSPATADAVADALHAQAGRLDVLHFIGQGHYEHGEGVLVLDGTDGHWVATPVSQLAPAIAASGARLALLSACQSAMVSAERHAAGLLGSLAPALVAQGVPFVIAMQLTMRSAAAHAASRVIYQQLASGAGLPAAVAAARLHLWTSERDRASWYVPTLYVRTCQPSEAALISA